MKNFIIILFLSIGLFSCDSKKETIPTCEFSDPLEDLAWLKEYKENLTDNYTVIYRAIYNRKVVFYSVYVNPAANTIWRITLWDCEGNTVRVFEREDKGKYDKLVSHHQVIYRYDLFERYK